MDEGIVEVTPVEGCSQTQRDFVQSENFDVCLVGPRGEGKTEAGLRRMTQMSACQPEHTRPVPWLIVRDTWANLERTTLKSILSPHPGSFGSQIRPFLKVRDGGRQIELPGLWHATLFGIDSLGDLDNLQSMQLGGLWVEEPAPAAVEDIGGGMDERVVTMGISSLRHPCSWQTVQITCNYPDEEHWVWRRYARERVLNRVLFRIPAGENPHLPKNYRSNMAAGFKNDLGLLQRLVLGQPGMVVQGKAVAPEFDLSIHKADIDLQPYPNMPAFRFWDGGLNPTCIFSQITPRGYLHIFPYTLVGNNIGMEQLIIKQVKPVVEEYFKDISEWRDICDPALFNREQSSSTVTGAQVIAGELNASPEPGPVLWSIRREVVKASLNKEIDGRSWIKVSANERQLTRALRGGWHYKVDATGRVLNDIPVKDIHSHPGDAFSYGVGVLLEEMRFWEDREEFPYWLTEAMNKQKDYDLGRSKITGY